MSLKLYGTPTSICTRRVSIVLHELRLSYEFIPVDLAKGEQKSPEYLGKNLYGQVPLLDDDGLLVHDSAAIVVYLTFKYRDIVPLCPAFTDIFGMVNYAQAAIQQVGKFTLFEPYFLGKAALLKGSKSKAALELTKDPEFLQFEETLDGYERVLSKRRYLASDHGQLTSVDLIHLPLAHFLPILGINVMYDMKRPNVVRWFYDVSSRPSWKANEFVVTPFQEATSP